ncbi:hypothetical protein KIPB_015396, partial [Kipferlia bialata]|eukprot:g15396.t1
MNTYPQAEGEDPIGELPFKMAPDSRFGLPCLGLDVDEMT